MALEWLAEYYLLGAMGEDFFSVVIIIPCMFVFDISAPN
jgi:hypothetical protein